MRIVFTFLPVEHLTRNKFLHVLDFNRKLPASISKMSLACGRKYKKFLRMHHFMTPLYILICELEAYKYVQEHCTLLLLLSGLLFFFATLSVKNETLSYE